ncbi:MAG: alanyl-tRNA editing protein [Pseudomonadota bacterium]
MSQKLYLESPYEKEFEAEVIAVSENGIRLSQSLFYPTSGGQPGDMGKLIAANDEIMIATTVKGEAPDDVWHIPAEGSATPQVGSILKGHIDWDTRYKHMRMHTAMHLLCSIVEGYATGGQISAEKSRLDFNIPAGAYDKEGVTEQLNALIKQDHPISTSWITDEELESNPDLVRTMSVKPPMGTGKVRVVQIGTEDNIVDYQPCGGTHVQSTREIGDILVRKIENKGKQNKRFQIIFAE